jgi:hypothetical protein
MNNPLLTINRYAEAAVSPYTICRAGTVNGKVLPASASNQPLFGLVGLVGADTGKRVDVNTHGFAPVKLGGSVNPGDPLTSDADALAVAASFGSNGTVYLIGFAEEGGVAGDIISVRIAPAAVRNEEGLLTLDAALTSAQILALNATPIQVIAAPGANKAIVLLEAEAYLAYNSAAYAGIAAGEDLALRYTDGSGTILGTFETTGFLDQTSSQIRRILGAALTPVANAPLIAHMTAGEIITGNSPLKLRIRYRIIDTVF